MKNILLLFMLVSPIVSYSKYVFINSLPSDATVFIIENEKSKNKIGTTPLRLTNVVQKIKIVAEKEGYAPVTNLISPSEKIQNIELTLDPLTFALQFPNIHANISVQNKVIGAGSGMMLFPYGNYGISFDKKHNLLINYKSPYLPYVAFFSTITAFSVVIAIVGGMLGSYYYGEYQKSQSQEQAVGLITQTAAADSAMWSAIGIGTAGLIGTAVSGYFEAKERKRMKRFNDLNTPDVTLTPLREYQEILLDDINTPSSLIKINKFIKKYEEIHPQLIGDLYLKKISVYINNKNFRDAIEDLNKIIQNYPTISNYEMAYKMLGDVYLEQHKYQLSYTSYQKALEISQIYSSDTLTMLMLNALYLESKENKKMVKEFLEKSENVKGLKKDQIKLIENRRQEFTNIQ